MHVIVSVKSYFSAYLINFSMNAQFYLSTNDFI